MGKVLYVLAVAVATEITTQTVFRLSHFRYGLHSVSSQPFDLVSFTVEYLWWFGAWFFFWFAFGALGRYVAGRRRRDSAASRSAGLSRLWPPDAS